MVNVPDRILKEMHEDMVDCVAIAGSALTLAVERSMDLKIPPQIALTTLKVLVELNLQKSMDEHQIPKSAHELCDILGVDLDDASEFAHEELEKLIRVWISHAKLKEVIIG